MKKLSILALSAVMSIAPAFAEVNSTATPAQTTTQEVDLSFAFDDIENLQVKEMTVAQMQETQGAALPFVAGVLMGGAIGAWTNHGASHAKNGRLASTKSTLYATGGGMVGGVYSGAMLKGAGISTSIFAKSAWKGGTGVANATIRTNGAFLGQGTVGGYKYKSR